MAEGKLDFDEEAICKNLRDTNIDEQATTMDGENAEKSAENAFMNDSKTMYGTIFENLNNMNSQNLEEDDISEIKASDPDGADDNAFLGIHEKQLKGRCSLESGKELNDKYEQQESNGSFLQLNNLPPEIFLHICSFIDAKFVIKTVSLVCKLFHSLVNDETFWRVRIGQRWQKKFPAIPVNNTSFNWANACIEVEEQHRLWSDHENNMQYYGYTEGLYAAVDVVHLMKNGQLLAAGSRDRYLTLLDLTKLDHNEPKESLKQCRVFSKMNAHKGWIWSLCSMDTTLVTGSWDTNVKLWDLTKEEEYLKMKCQSAILCTHCEPQCVLAGGYDRKVYHLDPRTGNAVKKKRYHNRPVLCMAVDDNYIITGSEDCTVAVYDRRIDKVYKTLKMESYPMSLSYGGDQLWLGDKEGTLHLVDATDGDFNIVETYPDIHKGKITGIQHGLGSIFTSSTDKTIKVLEPTQQPGEIATLSRHTADIAGISYQQEVLACASSDVSIGIWMPKQ